MNAQEALNEIVRLFDQMDLPEDYTKFIELKDGFASLQKLVHQSNEKPKTLEELGWWLTNNRTIFGREYQTYEKNEQVIFLGNDDKSVRVFDYRNGMCLPCDLSYEELLAIAEKMKELGMTGEQIAKGETK